MERTRVAERQTGSDRRGAIAENQRAILKGLGLVGKGWT